MDENGQVTEVIPQRVGFRRFEMKDSIMMLNGKRIVFKGVNRHEFSSVSGRVVSREELIKDLVTMKTEQYQMRSVPVIIRMQSESMNCVTNMVSI